MSVAWVAVGATVLGAAASADSSRHAANTQKDIANAQLSSADKQLEAQIRQADELLAFNKQQYTEGKARQETIDAINKTVIDQQLAQQKKAGERADEQYDFYKNVGRPVIAQSIEDAKNFDSQGNIDASRGRATADVQQAYDNAESQSQRALTRMGVNPSSGRFLALQQRVQADKAAALAGAATNAETNTRNTGVALRQQASNLASGFPATSVAQSGVATSAGNSAVGAGGATVQQNQAVTQQALNAMQAGAGIYGNAAAGYGNLYGSANNQLAQIQQSADRSAAGWGNLAGSLFSSYKPTYGSSSGVVGNGWLGGVTGSGSSMGGYTPDGYSYSDMGGSSTVGMGFADGGKISGPGTGTSDSVPAVNVSNGQPIHLSNGEYVLSSDTVRAVGTKFLDNLQAKHHKPVNLGR